MTVDTDLSTHATALSRRVGKPKSKSHRKNCHAVALGRKGGKSGTGSAKARTSAQARAAALARWTKTRETHE